MTNAIKEKAAKAKQKRLTRFANMSLTEIKAEARRYETELDRLTGGRGTEVFSKSNSFRFAWEEVLRREAEQKVRESPSLEGKKFLLTLDTGYGEGEHIQVTLHYTFLPGFGEGYGGEYFPAFYEGEKMDERLVNPDRILATKMLP